MMTENTPKIAAGPKSTFTAKAISIQMPLVRLLRLHHHLSWSEVKAISAGINAISLIAHGMDQEIENATSDCGKESK